MPTYAHVAWCYDAIASAYSLGAIDRAKAWHVAQLKPGDRVLYVGAGTGKEIALACRVGADIVCVEPCPAMARRLRKRLQPWRDQVTIHEEPLERSKDQGKFDWVVGHFFFNVFDPREMPDAIALAVSHLKKDGRMVIADFAPGRGVIDRFLHTMYYRPINLAGWLLEMCALHPIYDYAQTLEHMGYTNVRRSRYGFYEVVVALKE